MTDDEKLAAACLELALAESNLRAMGYRNIAGLTLEQMAEINEDRARQEARQTGAMCAIAAIKKRMAAAHQERLS